MKKADTGMFALFDKDIEICDGYLNEFDSLKEIVLRAVDGALITSEEELVLKNKIA